MVAQRIPRDRWLEVFERQLDALRGEGDREHRKTYDEVFDRKALFNIYSLFSKGILNTVEHPISTGKEANVFKATGSNGEDVVLKIFREATSTFKCLLQYIEGDPRFKNVGRGRKIISLWAQKEFKNLKRLEKVGVPVPRAIAVSQNMLVMEYVGDDYSPALRLKDCSGAPLDFDALFLEIMENIDRMVKDAGIVHADLSEYNILLRPEDDNMAYHEILAPYDVRDLPPPVARDPDDTAGEVDRGSGSPGNENAPAAMPTSITVHPVIIDLGQATLLAHPMAEEFLARDLKNIVRFFVKNRLLEDGIDEKKFVEEKFNSLLKRD